MKILLVEDDAAAAQILKETLEIKQYSVDCAADGETAWELAEAFFLNAIAKRKLYPAYRSRSYHIEHPNMFLAISSLIFFSTGYPK